MNKKEFIEKLKEHGAWCTECHDINGEKDRYVKVAKVRELLEQLDEPQKVKVPECVAEYIEAHRKWGPEIFIGDWLADNDAVYKWLYNNSEKENNRRFLIAVKAFVEGYEVEDEPKYRVNIGGLYLKEPLADTNDFTISMTWNKDYAYPFDSWNMAREHTSKLGGAVEKV